MTKIVDVPHCAQCGKVADQLHIVFTPERATVTFVAEFPCGKWSFHFIETTSLDAALSSVSGSVCFEGEEYAEQPRKCPQ